MSFGIGAFQSGNRSSTIVLPSWSDPRPKKRPIRSLRAQARASIGDSRFSVCTADELHFVSVPNSGWNLALWRYLPSPQVKKQRNYPLLLLSGIATNAIGYDLSPECSFARYMSGKGFDTWILELRGSGLSTFGLDLQKVQKKPRNFVSENGRPVGFYKVSPFSDRVLNRLQSMTKSREDFTSLSGTLSSLSSPDFDYGMEVSDSKQWHLNMPKETKNSIPSNIFGQQENILATVEEFWRSSEFIFKYDWDFDNFLEEDLPAAMEYIRSECEPEDGKLHAIGHSMGGILLYSRLSQFCSKGIDSGLVSITALASSLDYSTSRSSLKLLLPMADPIQALNVPAIPIGAMLAAIHPFVSYPPYILSWLKGQVSAHEMMSTELYEKLLLNNFCTVPAKLLLQLSSAFYKGGLRNRNGSFFYKDHLHKTDVPVLAIGGDQDRICPPEAVYETVKHIPENMVTLKILGEPSGPHYAHYDVVGSHIASEQVYPRIVEFLDRHDS